MRMHTICIFHLTDIYFWTLLLSLNKEGIPVKNNKTSSAVLIFIIILSLFVSTGCRAARTETSSTTGESHDLIIISSFYPIHIMTLNITKDIPGVQAVCLTKPFTGCLHDYQLTPDDVVHLEKAQVLITNGLGMEGFLDKVTVQLPNLKIISAGQDIHALTGADGETNPHVWVSIGNNIRQVKNIGTQLASLDPAHAEQYRANTYQYVQKLENLHSKMKSELSQITSKDIITFHEAFPYFADEFGLHIAAVVEREPGAEPSAAELASMIQLINNSGIKVIFTEPQYSTETAETISRETQAKIFSLDPGVTGPDDPDAYLNIMESNLVTLLQALK